MDVGEPYVPPTKIPRPKFTGKHKSKTDFQKFSNTYPMIVYTMSKLLFIQFKINEVSLYHCTAIGIGILAMPS